MQWILQRGVLSGTPISGEVLMRFGSPPRVSPGLTICCDLSSTPHIYICQGQAVEAVEALVEESTVTATLARENCEPFSVTFSARPWWQGQLNHSRPAATDRWALSVSFQGWRGDVWYDGPLSVARGGRVYAWVAAGAPGRLLWKSEGKPEPLDVDDEALKALWNRDSGVIWLQSLATGLRLRLKLEPRQAYRLAVPTWDALSLATLVILRAAYPNHLFGVDQLPPSPQWKRLCQNLNLNLRERRTLPLLPLAGMWPSQDLSALAEFVRALQVPAPLVPAMLFRELFP